MYDYLTHLKARGLADTSCKTRFLHLQRIERVLGKSLIEASSEDLEKYLAQAGLKREYKRSLLASMRSYYKYLQVSGKRADNPTSELGRIKPAEPTAQPTPDIAYYRALKEADTRDWLLIQLAGVEGMRRGEVAQVHKRDFIEDLCGYSLLVHGKGSKERVIPLTDELARALVQAFKESPNGYAFPGRENGHLSAAYIGKRVSRLLPEGYSMHSLRHRAATNVHKRGRDMLLTQKFLGHSSPETTQRYVHLDMEDLRKIIA